MLPVNTEYTDKRACAAFGEAGDDVETPDFRLQKNISAGNQGYFFTGKRLPFHGNSLEKGVTKNPILFHRAVQSPDTLVECHCI